MNKRNKILTLIGVAVTSLNAGPASAQYEGLAVHRTTLYSDATKTTVVGHIELQYCTYYGGVDGAQFMLEGTFTYFQDEELIGYCYQGSLNPV